MARSAGAASVSRQVTSHPSRHVVRYELSPRDELPRIDLSNTIKDAILPPRLVHIYNRVFKSLRRLIVPCYTVAVVFRMACFFVPAPLASFLAVSSAILNFPATVVVTLSLQVEYVRLLVRNFEYWYFFVLNTAGMSALAVTVTSGDGSWLRVCVVPFMWIEFQNATLLDAYGHNLRAIVYSAMGTIVQIFLLNSAVVFDFIHGTTTTSQKLLQTSYRSTTTRDVVVFSLHGVAFLMARLVYRHRTLLKQKKRRQQQRRASVRVAQGTPPSSRSAVRTVQSIAYRSKLVLTLSPDRRDLTTTDSLASPPDTLRALFETRRATTAKPISRIITMRLAKSDSVVYRAPIPVGLGTLEQVWIYARVALAALSLTSLSLSFHRPPVSRGTHNDVAIPTVTWVAVASTLLVLVPLARHFSCNLLHLWLTSFDTAMLSFKLTIVHVLACDAFHWHLPNCLSFACSWLWWHWVITLDVLPPLSKKHLGLRVRRCLVPVLLLGATGLVLLVCELVFWNHWHLADREILSFYISSGNNRHRVVFRLVPFLLSRLVAVFVWACRLLYCTVTSTSNADLLLLRGTIEYDLLPRIHPRQAVDIPTTN